MESLEAEVSKVGERLKTLLEEQAREKEGKAVPLVLRVRYQQELKVEDSRGEQWQVDEFYLEGIRHIYTQQEYKLVRLTDWHTELTFAGKRCTRLEIVSNDAEFHSRAETRRILACHFKFTIAHTPAHFDKLGQEVNGYLNRIGKRDVCSLSKNINKELKSLISFAPRPHKLLPPPFKYQPWKKEEKELQAAETLSATGLETMEKVRHFVKLEGLTQFIQDSRLSDECANHLRQLIKKAYGK